MHYYLRKLSQRYPELVDKQNVDGQAPPVMSTLSATNRSRLKVLGYPVDAVNQARALEAIESAWERKRGMQVVTLNAEMVVAAQQDAELDRIIRHAHLIIPDGAGVVWAVKLGGEVIERVPGIELAGAALDAAARRAKTVGLVGGKPEVIEALLKILPQRYQGLRIVYSHHGYFSLDDEDTLVDEATQYELDLVLIALGVPKQEYFIDRWQHRFPSSVLIGVGGSFDVWAGNVKRAPELFRKLNLEWFYRLISEPWRWRRMMSSLPNFFFQVLSDSLKKPTATEKKKDGKPPRQ